MKIQCDVCNQREALVYCSADAAALCSACDHRVHHANNLAGKHPRYPLLHPPPKDSPICDICHDNKAFLFCQQDRATLCKDCDVAIHRVNQHTRNHHRFLLTGVKLSPTTTAEKPLSSPIANQTTVETPICHREPKGSDHGLATSSISEYLIETLPGWHVEDFLDPPAEFSKELQVVDNDLWSNWGGDMLDGSLNSSFSPESMGIWVPQAPSPAPVPEPQYAHVPQQFEPKSNMRFGDRTTNGSTLSFAQNNCINLDKIRNGSKSSRKWVSDNGNCFMVPQMSPSSSASKRSRTLWH